MADYRKSTIREYFESIVIAVILALFIRTWGVQAFKIPTGSMEPNLLVGDHLLVNKFVFAPVLSNLGRGVLPVDQIQRGDVIVFKFPEDPERDFIKRVIGLPGEQVEIRDKVVHIDGHAIDEPYAYFRPEFDAGPGRDVRGRYGPVSVPEAHFFVMGDNRDNSQDSRYWGFLPAHYVKGRALVIYWSYETDGQEYGAQGVGATIRQLGSIVANFFTRTRWDRLLQQIR